MAPQRPSSRYGDRQPNTLDASSHQAHHQNENKGGDDQDSHQVPPSLLEEIRNHHIITDTKLPQRQPAVAQEKQKLDFQKVTGFLSTDI